MVITWTKAVSFMNLKILNIWKISNPPHFYIFQHRPKKIKQTLEDWKCMMIVALWKSEVIAYQILEEGNTVDSINYLNFLEHRLLPEGTRKKFWGPMNLHDNARPHKHRIVREFLEEKRWEELDRPPIALI